LLTPWAVEVRRDLPWRGTRDPWLVLVSEVMLQQTQVARVIPKWQAFVNRFPTAVSCAEAEQADVVRLWEGLGYHRRAVMLHRCAGVVARDHAGVVPSGLADLLRLPGIGPYTARAVRVFAYESDDAVLDTNVGRVLARALVGQRCTVADAQSLADSLVASGDGWAWNQGMLDLGAMICTKKRPSCADCPVASVCAWRIADPEGVDDPATGSAGVSVAQSRFQGSDRQGRGRMLDVLRRHPNGVVISELGIATGWDDDQRIGRTLQSLIDDELAVAIGETIRLR
jgi:A/G-specific adenine glycosylase